MGAHFEASDHFTPRRAARPLIKTDDRATKTKSCGNDFRDIAGAFGDSSLCSNPPGKGSEASSKSHMDTAAGPSGRSAPSLKTTPSSSPNSASGSKSRKMP